MLRRLPGSQPAKDPLGHGDTGLATPRPFNRVRGAKRYTASGTFVVPEGVYTVYVTGVGAGGGDTGVGGTTSFGSLLTMTGGNSQSGGGAGGSPNGFQGGVSSDGVTAYPFGGDSPWGKGGDYYTARAVKGYGAGGANTGASFGGGGGGWYDREPVSVNPGDTITVTIGVSSGGVPGTAGFLLVEW